MELLASDILGEQLSARHILKRIFESRKLTEPTSHPLYTYHITLEEYQDLKRTLRYWTVPGLSETKLSEMRRIASQDVAKRSDIFLPLFSHALLEKVLNETYSLLVINIMTILEF